MSDAIFHAGTQITLNEALTSGNGRTLLRLQEDRNLVLYKDNKPVWQAANAWSHGNILKVQGDGNVVLYDDGDHPVWASGTDGNDGAYLAVQDDGNAVVYDKAGSPIWATDTGD